MAAPPLTPPRPETPQPGAAPPTASAAAASGPAARPAPALHGRSANLLLLAVLALLAAACLPLGRVFIGLGFARPVAAAMLLSVGLSWAARRAGAGPLAGLVISALGFCLMVAIAFLPATLAFGVIPTFESAGAARDLWVRGLELVRVRPAPAFAEDGLILLTVTGVWWVSHLVEGLVFRLGAPLRAIGMALLLWTVPLAVAPSTDRVWAWAVPLLAAAAALLLLASGADLSRWGSWAAPPTRPGGRRHNPLVVAGWPVAAAAILAGALLGGMLPGFDEPPWYEVRGVGGTTLTTNPIVSIRSNLVQLSEDPVARVTSPRPLYLRLTALDVYGENEEWRSDGISGGDASGRLPLEEPMRFFTEVETDVEVQGLPGAVIVPVPYHPTELAGPVARNLQFDRNRATVTLARGAGLDAGERYQVRAAVPAPPPDLLSSSPVSPTPSLTALSGAVPAEVAELAREIVDAAGATTPAEQALAIQSELRTWEYSLDPPQGHGASAMGDFIVNRIGYCEQYAGTMAVMLRTLGIPARVAVGFTPGDLVDADAGIYQVRNANAHAWVEVRFDELGWIAFEPTPRTDGNVLVPSPTDAAPAQLESQVEAASEPEPADPDVPELPDTPETPPEPEGSDDPDDGTGSAAAGDEDGGGPPPLLLALLLLLGLGGVAVLLATRPDPAVGVPAEVVLGAFDRVVRLARGRGMAPRPAETDAELLARVAPGSRDAEALASAVARARWARTVPSSDARAAQTAAARLCTLLTGDLGPIGRAALHGRASAAGVADAVQRHVRRSTGADQADRVADQRGTERVHRLMRRRRGGSRH